MKIRQREIPISAIDPYAVYGKLNYTFVYNFEYYARK